MHFFVQCLSSTGFLQTWLRKWLRVRHQKAKKALNCIWEVIPVFVNIDYDFKINPPKK